MHRDVVAVGKVVSQSPSATNPNFIYLTVKFDAVEGPYFEPVLFVGPQNYKETVDSYLWSGKMWWNDREWDTCLVNGDVIECAMFGFRFILGMGDENVLKDVSIDDSAESMKKLRIKWVLEEET